MPKDKNATIEELKAQRISATSEEQALADARDHPDDRHSGAWEGDAEYVKAHRAAQRLANDPAAMRAAGGPAGAVPNEVQPVTEEAAATQEERTRTREGGTAQARSDRKRDVTTTTPRP